MQRDMTAGKPRKLLISFIIPLLISVVFQQLYTVFDSVIAGRAISSDALAAVGASYPITMIFMAVAVGSSAGVSVIVSQLFGARRMGEMKTAVQTALVEGTIVSAVLTIAGRLLCESMLCLLKTPDNIMTDSVIYLNIYIYGLFFLFLYNVVTGIFQALGDSRSPLYLLIASSVGNIILDLVFVIVFDMGVAGLGWGTFLAQGASAVIAFLLLIHYVKKMRITETSRIFSGNMLGKIAAIAVPSICQQSFVSIGNLFVQSVINQYGSSVIAGYNVGLKISMFVITCSFSFGNGLGSFAAQNLGAGKLSRVYEGFKEATRMIYIFIIPCFLVSFFGAHSLVRLFIGDGDRASMETAVLYLHTVTPFYLIVVMKFTCDNILKAAGAMREFMITTFSDLILRVAFAYIFSAWFGSAGIWWAWPVGWVAGTGFAIYFYKKRSWLRGWNLQ